MKKYFTLWTFITTNLCAMVEITQQQLSNMSPRDTKKFVEEHKLDTVKVESQAVRQQVRDNLQKAGDPTLADRTAVQSVQMPASPSTPQPGTESSSEGFAPGSTLQEVQIAPAPAPATSTPGLSMPRTPSPDAPQKASQ